MADGPWLVVGLGNPGPKYAGNRHNVGQMVVDLLAERIGGRFTKHKSRAEVVEGRLGGHRVVLAKPLSYMNESGGPVAGLRSYYRVPPEQTIVVHDELDIPFDSVRLKRGGGDNGHNGLRSISSSLGTKDYLRVRVGIGRPPGRQDPADFVLRDFSSTERKDLPLLVDNAADAAEALLGADLATVQNTFHAR
ncbi:aminoacyl-tRNA hydrolase [Cryptosporangium arvum]|uniref:Peptidyl-tRNA hydrolase n=1 Tax=Cryptosporangium arvum DSM 44712 TaxID=927661 RepID=A0A010YI18_9ACTN|nr:aminoacyl-tRNA hydrolase [Cryptosporangium arvum]EXG79925.1 peptidyl-tRNA hydrolase [Cryptosporangium arvum DSM 44712]